MWSWATSMPNAILGLFPGFLVPMGGRGVVLRDAMRCDAYDAMRTTIFHRCVTLRNAMEPLLIVAVVVSCLALLATVGQYPWVHHYVMNIGPPRTLEVARMAAHEAIQDVRENVAELMDRGPKLLRGDVDPRDAVEAREERRADKRLQASGGAYALLVDKLGPEWGKWAWENMLPDDLRSDIAKGSYETVVRVLGPIVKRAQSYAEGKAEGQQQLGVYEPPGY